jgi:ABC-type multidrug transport system fused ATPase/permease subunit
MAALVFRPRRERLAKLLNLGVELPMLTQLNKLTIAADGRYATDEELTFLANYVRSYELRVQTYQKIQASEAVILQQVYNKMKTMDPAIFKFGNQDQTAKCKRDTLIVLRHSVVALLTNDADALQERFLMWLQTIVRGSASHQRASSITYTVMQEVVKQHLNATQANLFLPILEMNRRILGS